MVLTAWAIAGIAAWFSRRWAVTKISGRSGSSPASASGAGRFASSLVVARNASITVLPVTITSRPSSRSESKLAFEPGVGAKL